ncbi:MAG: uncharacterized membrane protein YjjP (DUF1212 family) [Kiritimatiellia bacterium]|jgi:uncharacterized membrane protein YjjP (DUF1212 family)
MAGNDNFSEKRRFIIKLGKALHKYGTPAYRLEAHLQNVSALLEIKASFMVTPTTLTFILSEGLDQQDYNHIARVTPGDIDLGALARLDALVDELDSQQRTLTEAIERIDETAKQTAYGRLITFIAFGATSGSFAMLMNTSWNSILWSTLFGFMVAIITFWSEKSSRVSNMLEPFVALITALLASAVAIMDPSINVPLVILSSIIVYIPGLALTLGLSELSARHLISGTARVMDAVMSLFKLYFGAILGIALAALLWGDTLFTPVENVPEWTLWIAVTLLSLSLVVLFKARKRDIIWGVIAGYIAYGATLWGSHYLGPALGAFVGAFALGLYSNLFSRIMNLPSSIVMLLGLVMLVPGSKLYIGLNTIVSGQSIINTPDIGTQSFLIFMSLVAGLIFSDVIFPSQKTL